MKETAMDKPALRAQAELLAKLRKKRTGKTVDQIMQQLEREEMKREFDAAKAIRVQVKLKASCVKKGIKKGKKVAKCIIYDESWEGYSDEAGSVESGVLDENVCCDCGIKTNRKKECDELVLCDVCDSEYHIKCVGLERTRTRALAWTCPRCVEERTHFSSLSFSGGKKFQLPTRKKSDEKLGVCYSPSRPLTRAFQQCKRDGFMLVSKVLPYDVMRVLTHGTLEKKTHSGRIADTWLGGMNELNKQLGELTNSVIYRGGRYDIRLPDFVVDQLNLQSYLEPILSKLRSVMGTPRPVIRTQNLVFVPVGSPPQEWHCDDTIKAPKNARYFTILIHLNPIDSMSGGTELWIENAKKGDLIRGRPGDAFVFNGSLLHRGQANSGYTHHMYLR